MVEVEEFGVKYIISLDNGAGTEELFQIAPVGYTNSLHCLTPILSAATGLYLDQRENRQKLAHLLSAISRTTVPREANFVRHLGALACNSLHRSFHFSAMHYLPR